MYRVKAVNEAGASDPSETITILAASEPAEVNTIIFREVSSTALTL